MGTGANFAPFAGRLRSTIGLHEYSRHSGRMKIRRPCRSTPSLHPLQSPGCPLDFFRPSPTRNQPGTNCDGTALAGCLMPIRIPICILRTAGLILVATILGLSQGCGDNGEEANVLTVFAAASLTDAFQDIADQFQSKHPGVEVKLNFAGSQRLRTQLELGARADVFASADERQMHLARQAGLLANDARYFASTPMSVIVFEDSGISTLADLAAPDTKVVLAHSSVPAGEYSRKLLVELSREGAGLGEDYAERVLANVVSGEPSVKSAEHKVVLGQADASIVYLPGALTAKATGSARQLDLPPQADAVRALYPIAALNTSVSPEWRERFIDFVISPGGRSILESYGFAVP